MMLIAFAVSSVSMCLELKLKIKIYSRGGLCKVNNLIIFRHVRGCSGWNSVASTFQRMCVHILSMQLLITLLYHTEVGGLSYSLYE